MQLRLFLVLLKARYKLVLFTLGVTLISAAVITSLLQPQYSATASVVLNFSDTSPLADTVTPPQLSSSYVTTQLDMIKSDKVANKVIDDLHLEANPGLREAFQDYMNGGVAYDIVEFLHLQGVPGLLQALKRSSVGEDPMRPWLLELLKKGLTVDLTPNSRVVTLTYSRAATPQGAATRANAFARAYIASNVELTTAPAQRNAAWFDEQLRVMRKNLEDAQARLTTYQQESGIVALDERLDTETSRLAELSQEYVKAQAELSEAAARQLGRNHPEYVGAIGREKTISSALETQKSRVLELKKRRDKLDAMARDIASKQSTYDTMLKTYYDAGLRSQFNQTNIEFLSPATPPQEPDGPNLLLNLAVALFLGSLLGAVIAVATELLNRKLYSEEDVRALLNTKVLATV